MTNAHGYGNTGTYSYTYDYDGKGLFRCEYDFTAMLLEEGLAAMIAEAFAVRNQLLPGSDDSIEAMTERLGMGKGHLASLVRLSYLAPDTVRALLKSGQPIELTPTRLLRVSKELAA